MSMSFIYMCGRSTCWLLDGWTYLNIWAIVRNIDMNTVIVAYESIFSAGVHCRQTKRWCFQPYVDGGLKIKQGNRGFLRLLSDCPVAFLNHITMWGPANIITDHRVLEMFIFQGQLPADVTLYRRRSNVFELHVNEHVIVIFNKTTIWFLRCAHLLYLLLRWHLYEFDGLQSNKRWRNQVGSVQ